MITKEFPSVFSGQMTTINAGRTPQNIADAECRATLCQSRGRSRWVSEVFTETPFQILKKPFSLQFIFNVHGLSYINYLNTQTILLPDSRRLQYVKSRMGHLK